MEVEVLRGPDTGNRELHGKGGRGAVGYECRETLGCFARSRQRSQQASGDGVIAIIITIMVLEMKVPHGGALETLTPLVPVFMSYVPSFVTSASTGTNITTGPTCPPG